MKKLPLLTPYEASVVLGMLGDVDPAHFELPNGSYDTRAANAAKRAETKLAAIAKAIIAKANP